MKRGASQEKEPEREITSLKNNKYPRTRRNPGGVKFPTKPESPIVDIVIPCYNYAHTVVRAINSVASQTVTNFVCYIVDDGSTDNTRDVVETAIANDARFVYIYQDNSGVANARNKGVFSGNGKYVCCLDADDALDPLFLEACIKELEADPLLGIAYTGLQYIKPNGETGLSDWPGEYNYDEQLLGKNQIPTCNVSRRKMWERLGGQRQRYAPSGAGEEDAEMWLRAGAYGFNAKKVTDAGLFIYSWMSGMVSGSRSHKTTDYKAWHPWTLDGQHPFTSVATPAKLSHPVRQYDEPIVSVVIPVGNGHEEMVIEALDSLEAQSYRKWEAIVVDDLSDDASKKLVKILNTSYPYVRYVKSSQTGAGSARNKGAKIARGYFVLFLDADDFLLPNAISSMVFAWEREKSIIYTDHLGKAEMERHEANALQERLVDYNDRTRIALFKHGWLPYECEKAQRQPDEAMYHWCLVTTLIPLSWHNEIGGFDESMESWEDWDYHIRMARAGKCYSRIPTPLVVYRYYTGRRREDGIKIYPELIKYMRQKNERTSVMGCNCKKGTAGEISMPQNQQIGAVPQSTGISMADSDYVLVLYDHPNRGQHKVVGGATGIVYGYRAGGDKFLVHVNDLKAMQNVFVPVTVLQNRDEEPKKYDTNLVVEKEDATIEELVDGIDDVPFDFGKIGGITTTTAQMLNADGIYSLKDLIAAGPEKLTTYKGIGSKKAETILSDAKRIIGTLA